MTASSSSAARAAVDELEGLLAGATPGPWTCNDEPTTWVGGREGQVWSVPLRESGEFADEVADTMEHADAALIVAMHRHLPHLLAAVKAVDELHQPDAAGDCRPCCHVWPCPTAAAVGAALNPQETGR